MTPRVVPSVAVEAEREELRAEVAYFERQCVPPAASTTAGFKSVAPRGNPAPTVSYPPLAAAAAGGAGAGKAGGGASAAKGTRAAAGAAALKGSYRSEMKLPGSNVTSRQLPPAQRVGKLEPRAVDFEAEWLDGCAPSTTAPYHTAHHTAPQRPPTWPLRFASRR